MFSSSQKYLQLHHLPIINTDQYSAFSQLGGLRRRPQSPPGAAGSGSVLQAAATSAAADVQLAARPAADIAVAAAVEALQEKKSCDITAHTGDIRAHTCDITAHTCDITAHTGDITVHIGDITTHW